MTSTVSKEIKKELNSDAKVFVSLGVVPIFHFQLRVLRSRYAEFRWNSERVTVTSGDIPSSIVRCSRILFGIYVSCIHFIPRYAWITVVVRGKVRQRFQGDSQWSRKLTQPRALSIYVHMWDSSLRVPLYLLPHWSREL